MKTIFLEPILNIPKADVCLKGVNAYLSQSDDHQILYMKFFQDVDLQEHSYES